MTSSARLLWSFSDSGQWHVLLGPLLLQDQSKIETKIRNVHFLGELAKFKLAPPSLIFTCLRVSTSCPNFPYLTTKYALV